MLGRGGNTKHQAQGRFVKDLFLLFPLCLRAVCPLPKALPVPQPSSTPLAVPEDEQWPNCPSQKVVSTQAAVALPARERGDGAGQALASQGSPTWDALLFLQLKPPPQTALLAPIGSLVFSTGARPSLLIGEPRALHKTASDPSNWFPEFPSLALLRLCVKARRKRTRLTPTPSPGP